MDYNYLSKLISKNSQCQNCKAITASDVVKKPTRKCNGVTNLFGLFLKFADFISIKKVRSRMLHITMCMYVFSLILHSASDEMNFIIIANLVKVSEDARDAA